MDSKEQAPPEQELIKKEKIFSYGFISSSVLAGVVLARYIGYDEIDYFLLPFIMACLSWLLFLFGFGIHKIKLLKRWSILTNFVVGMVAWFVVVVICLVVMPILDYHLGR